MLWDNARFNSLMAMPSLNRSHSVSMSGPVSRHTDDGFSTVVDVGDMSKDKVNVYINGSSLVIEGHETVVEDGYSYEHSVNHSYYLPAHLRTAEVQATLKNGRLTVTVGKESPQSEVRHIPVKTE